MLCGGSKGCCCLRPGPVRGPSGRRTRLSSTNSPGRPPGRARADNLTVAEEAAQAQRRAAKTKSGASGVAAQRPALFLGGGLHVQQAVARGRRSPSTPTESRASPPKRQRPTTNAKPPGRPARRTRRTPRTRATTSRPQPRAATRPTRPEVGAAAATAARPLPQPRLRLTRTTTPRPTTPRPTSPPGRSLSMTTRLAA
jgi:hypothetical protein